MRVKAKQFFSPKTFLVRIHKDLFKISEFVLPYEDRSALSKLEKIILVLEDHRFFNHDGFDLIASCRETLKLITLRKHGGASTIDMQFVRTATGFRQKTFSRKIYEMLLARLIQYRYSKLSILRSYLNEAYLGSGIKGINAASRINFKKEVFEISDDEAALLAAMLVYPRPRKPSERWFNKTAKRAQYGLVRLRRYEKIFDQIPK